MLSVEPVDVPALSGVENSLVQPLAVTQPSEVVCVRGMYVCVQGRCQEDKGCTRWAAQGQRAGSAERQVGGKSGVELCVVAFALNHRRKGPHARAQVLTPNHAHLCLRAHSLTTSTMPLTPPLLSPPHFPPPPPSTSHPPTTRDLVPIIHWNEAHGIRVFRLSSNM